MVGKVAPFKLLVTSTISPTKEVSVFTVTIPGGGARGGVSQQNVYVWEVHLCPRWPPLSALPVWLVGTAPADRG